MQVRRGLALLHLFEHCPVVILNDRQHLVRVRVRQRERLTAQKPAAPQFEVLSGRDQRLAAVQPFWVGVRGQMPPDQVRERVTLHGDAGERRPRVKQLLIDAQVSRVAVGQRFPAVCFRQRISEH